MDCPPSWFIPASKETRVRVDGFSKNSPSVLPLNRWAERARRRMAFSSAASLKRASIASRDRSRTASTWVAEDVIAGPRSHHPTW